MFQAANQSSKQFVRPPVTFLELIYSDRLCVAPNRPSFPVPKKTKTAVIQTRTYTIIQTGSERRETAEDRF